MCFCVYLISLSYDANETELLTLHARPFSSTVVKGQELLSYSSIQCANHTKVITVRHGCAQSR